MPLWQTNIRGYFNPLHPCGRRPPIRLTLLSRLLFQSTPPVWAETFGIYDNNISEGISIHSTRVGGDYGNREREIFRSDFNPLHPCGRRHHRFIRFTSTERFQSTPPVWAETLAKRRELKKTLFQSTPPVWAETFSIVKAVNCVQFQSTPPVWAETDLMEILVQMRRFQSTPPVWAETFILLIFFFAFGFQSTPPVWAETYEVKGPSKKYYISIHSTRVGGDTSAPRPHGS